MKAQSIAVEEPGTDTTPVRVKKIGHIVFRVKDVEETIKFWTEVMGFHVSDRNEGGLIFLRCGSDHHTIGVGKAN